MLQLVNPSRLVRLSRFFLPWCALLAIGFVAAGLYFGLYASSAEMYQKQYVRIMYVHVPSAWMGLFVYSCMALSSLVLLIWKNPVAGMVARASAPIGATFTFLCLISGSFWGRIAWGGWWAWDARLTSMLVLLFLYIGYIALSNAFDDPARGNRAAAVLALIGWINIPIIKFSVEWWTGIHQPSLGKIGPDMLRALLLMATGFGFYYLTILIFRLRADIARSKIRSLRIRQARG